MVKNVLILIIFCGISYCSQLAVEFNKDISADINLLNGSGDCIDIHKVGSISTIKTIGEKTFSGFVGVDLKLNELQWRQYYHWWNILTDISGTIHSGKVSFIARCFDKDGQMLREIVISDDFASLGAFSQAIRRNCAAIAKAHPNDIEQVAVNVRLGFHFDNWRGTLRISNLVIQQYTLNNVDAQPFRRSDKKAEIGAMPWFEPSYTPIGTASEAMRDTAHKLFAAIGINKMRFMAIWGDHFRQHQQFRVEPTFEVQKGNYEFEKLDSYIKELDYYGHSIGVLTLWGTPEWAYSKTKDDIPQYKKQGTRAAKTIANATFPPDDWQDYRRFVKAMVSRYEGKIGAYEVWNEPDVWDYGLVLGYEAYIDYLENFYIAAKSVAPDVNVYAGRIGLWAVPCIEQGRLQDYCDAIAEHPYPGRAVSPHLSKKRVEQLIKSMISTDVVKPVVITEVGLGAGFPWPGPGGYHGEQAKAANARVLIEDLSQYSDEIYWYTPIEANRQYGILQYQNNRYIPNPIYYAFAEYIGRLNNENAPVKAEIILPPNPVETNKTSIIVLRAVNKSSQPQKVRLWPIGFIDDLGYSKFDDIRRYDVDTIIESGQSHQYRIPIMPKETAFGKYLLGFCVINENGNSLAVTDLSISSIAAKAKVRVSSCDEGSTDAINSLYEPVWSGDIDVPRLIWKAQDEQRKEWVQLDFDKPCEISEVSVYWVANPKPKHHFNGSGLEYDTYKLPLEWRASYLSNDVWIPFTTSEYPICANQYNSVSFQKTLTEAIKIEVTLEKLKPAGILQIKVR